MLPTRGISESVFPKADARRFSTWILPRLPLSSYTRDRANWYGRHEGPVDLGTKPARAVRLTARPLPGHRRRWRRRHIQAGAGRHMLKSDPTLCSASSPAPQQWQRRSAEQYNIVMSGRRPPIKGLFSAMGRSRVRSCLRPVVAVL